MLSLTFESKIIVHVAIKLHLLFWCNLRISRTNTATSSMIKESGGEGGERDGVREGGGRWAHHRGGINVHAVAVATKALGERRKQKRRHSCRSVRGAS
jgi:hypothetical protein